jgi:hypothetical protein
MSAADVLVKPEECVMSSMHFQVLPVPRKVYSDGALPARLAIDKS